MSATRDTASIAPIIVALMTLVSISMLGFLVAFWPAESAEAQPPARSEAAPAKWM